MHLSQWYFFYFLKPSGMGMPPLLLLHGHLFWGDPSVSLVRGVICWLSFHRHLPLALVDIEGCWLTALSAINSSSPVSLLEAFSKKGYGPGFTLGPPSWEKDGAVNCLKKLWGKLTSTFLSLFSESVQELPWG